MRKIKVLSMILLGGGIFLGATSTQAGVLGKSYAQATYKYVKVDNIDDSYNLYGADVRLGNPEGWDVVAGFGLASEFGVDMTRANVGIQPYWKPKRGFYKVFADARFLYNDWDGSKKLSDDSDTGYSVGVGGELCHGKKFSVMGQVDYVNIDPIPLDVLFPDADDDDDNDDIVFHGSANFWATDWLLLRFGAGYGFNSKNITAMAGAAVSF